MFGRAPPFTITPVWKRSKHELSRLFIPSGLLNQWTELDTYHASSMTVCTVAVGQKCYCMPWQLHLRHLYHPMDYQLHDWPCHDISQSTCVRSHIFQFDALISWWVLVWSDTGLLTGIQMCLHYCKPMDEPSILHQSHQRHEHWSCQFFLHNPPQLEFLRLSAERESGDHYNEPSIIYTVLSSQWKNGSDSEEIWIVNILLEW